MRIFGIAPPAALLILCFVCVAGCDSNKSLVPVEGKVTLDSKPLADATVLLSSTRGNGPGPFVGTTDKEGRFALGPIGKAEAGAVADSYTVMITTAKPDPNSIEGASAPNEIVPLKYRDGSQRFKVPEGGSKSTDFEIKTK